MKGARMDERAAESLSALTRSFLTLVEAVADRTLSESEQWKLEEIVRDHGLEGDDPPAWMIELFDRLLHRRVDRRRREIPEGYPRGENGLANLLSGIHETLVPLKVDDYGEGVDWPISQRGVRVIILREGTLTLKIEGLRT